MRLNLNQLDNFDKAKQVVREYCQTATCAGMIAAQCEKKGYKDEAVEFLIMAGKKSEAFALVSSATVRIFSLIRKFVFAFRPRPAERWRPTRST